MSEVNYSTGVDRLTSGERDSLRENILGRAETVSNSGCGTPCWLLPEGLGGRNGDSHKSIWVRSKVNTKSHKEGRTQLAHRIIYELCVGPIGEMKVLHRCDDGRCVNPDHLFLGTQKDNVLDMEAKGRAFHPCGECSGHAKLTDEKVVESIRLRKSGKSYYAVAKIMGVSKQAARFAIIGKTWTHIDRSNL